MKRTIAIAALAIAANGCIVRTDFEPVGNAATISGTWTIDGAPPTADTTDPTTHAVVRGSCTRMGTALAGAPARAGAALVRVAFLDGAREVIHGNLLFPCVNGTFDTAPNKLVGAGMWRMEMQAVDGAGNVLEVGPVAMGDASTGAIAMPTVDFGTAQISASWTIGGTAPTVESCTAAGLDNAELVFSGIDAPQPQIEPCAAGVIGRHLHPGTYSVALLGLGPAGSVMPLAPETLAVESGIHATLNGGNAIELP